MSTSAERDLALVSTCIERAEELLRRDRLDWPIYSIWTGDTEQVLNGIFGEDHHKTDAFRDAGEPFGVRRRYVPADATPMIKRQTEAKVWVLREFETELRRAAEAQSKTRFTRPARVRLWHLLNKLFPSTQYDLTTGDATTTYQEDLEEHLQRSLDVLGLADGLTAEKRLQEFVLNVADDSTMTQAIAALPDAYSSAHAIPAYEEDRLLPECLEALNTYLESIGHELRFDRSTYQLTKPGFELASPKPIDDLPRLPDLLNDLRSLLMEGRPVAVVAFDVDGLKAVNDSTGSHAVGDTCLQKVVDEAGSIAAGRGRVYRVGGDEFVIALQNNTTIEAAATGERLRCAVERVDAGRTARINVTVSVGVASSEDAQTPESLREAADKASYVAKFTGKNRVVACPVDPKLRAEAEARQAEAKGR